MAAFVAIGVVIGAAASVADGIIFILIFLRLWFYGFEIIQQSLSYFLHETPKALSCSPIFFHELSYLPLPFLGRMIEDTATLDVELAHRALDQCSIIPGQYRTGKRVLIRLQWQELQQQFQQQAFEPLHELKGEWLPARSNDNDETLRRISEIGRYLHAYQIAISPHHQLQHLNQAADQLQGIHNYFLSRASDWSRTATSGLKHWVAAEQQTIRELAERVIVNPFSYGRPLTPEFGHEVFQGRKTIALHIEQLLADQQQSLSIALLAPRRCGKSSILKMLLVMLPEAIFVFYDLQDNTVDSVEGFFRSLVARAQTQAYQDRGIKLPDLPPGTPFEAGRLWFEQTDHGLQQPLLICMDEFERLPDLFPGTQQQLLQLMALFRATIQHRQHVRLLVSGAAPFDELERVWDDHFINVQEIHLPHLDKASSLQLLRQPIPSFPTSAIPEAVAEAIFTRTQGQPFLLQAFAGITIEHLNQKKRSTATLTMLNAIEEAVMIRCTTYFRDVYSNAPEAARQVLYVLSHGKNCDIDRASERWLRRRLLLTEQQQLNIPVFGRWIRKLSEAF